MSSAATSLSPHPEQFRMRRLQVLNWGTFNGLHDIPIAEQGYLLVGKSGSGKSTLLDALSALLIPPRWRDFNAAAETERTGRDRNWVSYIRGAWAEQQDSDSGEIATRYLRTGATWSAIAVTFQNGLDKTVVLVQICWIRGSSNALSDVRQHFFIFERPFDVRELQGFDLDIRKLKQSLPDAFSRDEFRPYCERFCRLLGIESEMALRLLHKTQSAKSLGDLNALLRNFMLDKPGTFLVADQLVAEFAELNAAHQTVVKAREQVGLLSQAHKDHEQFEMLQAQRIELGTCRSGVNTYRETLRLGLTRKEIAALQVEAAGSTALVQKREEEFSNRERLRDDLQQQQRELGGDRIEQWEREKEDLEKQRDQRSRKRQDTLEVCNRLGWTLPDSPQAFAELIGKARLEIEGWQKLLETAREQYHSLTTEKNDAESRFAVAVREVKALQRQPSNIGADMLELRDELAGAIGIHASALPFVGELIEVLPEEAPWRGAIERVLRGFALSVLVDEQHYVALSNYLNEADTHRRLVYYRTGRPESWQRPLAPNSLVLKLRTKDGPFTDWLQAELRRRFDYCCVDSMKTFRASERALTREGQVKSKLRHEKNDRVRVDDRTQWVLGFDNREKLALFEKEAQSWAAKIAETDRRLRELKEAENRSNKRAMSCQFLVNLQWQEIDCGPMVSRIAAIDKLIRQTREESPQLLELGRRLAEQSKKVAQAQQSLVHAKAELQEVSKKIEGLQRQLRSLQSAPPEIALTEPQAAALESRFAAVQSTLTLNTLDPVTTKVVQKLSDEEREIGSRIGEVQRGVEKSFADFKRRWPMDAGDMDDTMASARDFFAMLARLETDGLPAHEQHFFGLLRNQSHQNLAALSTHLTQARKAILEGMAIVNEGLKHAEFNPGTFLQIEATDRQLEQVKQFRHEIQEALSYAWTDDRKIAEDRFIALQAIVDRLSSQEPEVKRWRELVLDVRQHVEFIGREFTHDGVEVEVYRSGAGKSGGQRQKLATTCLAAALRYQLGGGNHGVPPYAPVVLDEAFDKSDNEFTDLSVRIFVNFGFQMIVATPLKAVMTLEPFIGGACFVEIADRRRSGVLLIEYDTEEQRLKLPERAREVSASETA